MSSQASIDGDREYRLIEQLELRIANANTDAKFETVTQKFLSALVLKVGSENVRNRNLAIKVCQHVNNRLKLDTSISVPVQSLLKTFRESQNAFVSRFALMFIEQGLGRLPPGSRSEILPDVLRGSVPDSDDVDAVKSKMWSVAFDFLLDVFRTWRVPDHATNEDTALKETLSLSEKQSQVLSNSLSNFISYEAKTQSSWKKPLQDFQPIFDKYAKVRSQIIVAVAKFLFTSVFNDMQRFIPAVLLSVDPNDAASGISDVMFKQCSFDLEQDALVDILFDLFDLGRPKLQTRILTLLSRSQRSTSRASKILDIIEQELFRGTAGLEAAKLRAAVFQYLAWAVRVSTNLSTVRDRLQVSLREYVELQGWPIMSQAAPGLEELRAKAYESIGLLAATKSADEMVEPMISLDLVTWLFTSLRCDTSRDVRSSVDEALSRVLNVANFSSNDELQNLKSLLLWNVQAEEGDEDPTYHLRSVNSTRYIALRFANKVLPFEDVDARYIDVVALGYNDRREVAEESNRGLDPYWHVTNSRISTGHQVNSKFTFPPFSTFVQRTFDTSRHDHAVKQNIASLTAAVMFARNLLVCEALTGSESEVDVNADWGQKLDALISNDQSVRQKLRTYMTKVDASSLKRLVESSILGLSLGSTACSDIAFDLVSLSSNTIIQTLQPEILPQLSQGCLNNAVQGRATRVYGIIHSLAPQVRESVREALSSCSSWSTAVGQDVITVRASLLCAGYALTRMTLRGFTESAADLIDDLCGLASKIITESHDKSLKHAAYLVIGQLCLCLPSTTPAFKTVMDLTESLMSDAKKEDEIAVTTLGRILGVLHSLKLSSAKELLERLYGLHEVRKAELHFSLGEALTTAALGFQSGSTLSEFDVDASKPDWGYQPDLLAQILDRATTDVKTTKPSLKKASAIWLLCLIQYCDDATLLKDRLRDCQAAFMRLLNDRDDIVQETGSRGLSLVYEKGDKSLRDDLVRDLVQSFTGGNTKMSGTVDEETQLFEAGALPTEGGQSVQTYKDIVSLATEMGDPSLVYRFMNLASTNAIWSSRAAFGRFGLSGVLADSTYLTENKKFYPKLFRYRFDPNPNVQRSMDEIWKALVKDSNKVVEENFDLIMTDLLKSVISGKEWRAREASCAAITDLVQGRDVEKFEQYLDEIWTVAFKVLDDVKETVRLAAMKFCRALTGMLIRNLEVGEGTTKRATTMMHHALPFLLQQMDSGSAQDVQQYAVITLLEIVKKCPLRSLRPFAPMILERLVLSLSSLEHESINYLHLNADKYGLTAEKLDKMRVSSINASPISEAIERCLDSLFTSNTAGTETSDSTNGGIEHTAEASGNLLPTDDAMQRLAKAFKAAIGLPSKVGLSRVMITLVVRHHTPFRPYANQFLQLTRKHILDRNATISVSFSMALGYLVRLASPKEVDETSRFAQQLYFDSQELAHRAVAAEIIQAISKASNDVFMNFASTFLPFAFIGRNDRDAEVQQRFDPPWKDNIGGSRALNLYLTDIVSLISKHIKSSLWPIKQACCLAVADLVSSMDGGDPYSEAEARLLWDVMEESLNGKTWSGKEKVISAFPTFVKRARSLWVEKGKQIRLVTLREAKRNNVAYRPHALTALGEVASACPVLELDETVLEVLTNVLEQLKDQGDAMDVDGGEEDGSSARYEDATYAAVFGSVFQILTDSSHPDVLDRALAMVREAHGKISAKIDMQIYDGARRYITQATQAGLSSADGSGDGQVRVPPLQAENRQEKRRQPPAAFLHGLVLAVFDADECARRHASDNESVRKSRAGLAQALAESPALPQPARHLLTPTLRACLQGERSRPLRMELEKTLSLLET